GFRATRFNFSVSSCTQKQFRPGPRRSDLGRDTWFVWLRRTRGTSFGSRRATLALWSLTRRLGARDQHANLRARRARRELLLASANGRWRGRRVRVSRAALRRLPARSRSAGGRR